MHCFNFFTITIIFLQFILTIFAEEQYANSTTVLRRKKRYMAFPDGSSVSAAICLTIGVVGNPHVDYLSWAENWGVAYDLPNYAWARKHANGFKNITKALMQRRSRRSLYEKLNLAMDSMGFNGNACMARALCESAQFGNRFRERKGNMIEEIIKTIFSFPSDYVERHEPDDHHFYAHVYRRAKRSTHINCAMEYAECKFSLMDLVLGKYSVAPVKHGPAFAFM